MKLKPNGKGNGNKKVRLIIFIVSLGIIAFLINYFMPGDPYDINRYFTKDQQDTLMTNIVTYMGVKPRNTDWQTRHNPQHRAFYKNQAKNYSFIKYFIDNEEIHYFYIIRPARHPLGNRRAIGGRFRVDEHLNLSDYEELFVTQVLDETYLKEIASDLFKALINNNLEEYLNNRLIIEWPDDRLKYDRVKKEWRYDVKDNG